MIERFIRQQIEKKTFPGVSILAAAGDRVLYERCFGRRATWPAPEPLDGDTLFDLASLTKPLVTAFLAAYFIEKKQWRLDDEARRFLPAAGAAGHPGAIADPQRRPAGPGTRSTSTAPRTTWPRSRRWTA